MLSVVLCPSGGLGATEVIIIIIIIVVVVVVVVVAEECFTKHDAFDSMYDHCDNMWIKLLKWNIWIELQEIFTGEARWKVTYIWEFAVLLAAHIAFRFLFTDDKKNEAETPY
jgi:hypothetical protein